MISCGCLPSMLQPTDWAVPRISLMVPAEGRYSLSVLYHRESFSEHVENLIPHTSALPPSLWGLQVTAVTRGQKPLVPKWPSCPRSSTTPLHGYGPSREPGQNLARASSKDSVQSQQQHLPESSRARDLCRICRAMFTISSKLTLPLCLTVKGSSSTMSS